MTAFDPGSLSHWESFADWGTKFVIVGVAGEGLELFIKFIARPLRKRASWRHFFHKADPWIDFVGTVFWIMVVCGLWAEFKGNHMSKIILDKDNAQLHLQAESNEVRVAEMGRTNLAMLQALIGFEVELERGISDELGFANALRAIPGIRVKMAIAQTSDSARLANDLRFVMTAGGWQVDLLVPPKPEFPEEGVVVSDSATSHNAGHWPPTDRSHEAAVLLIDLLTKEGIGASQRLPPEELPPNTVEVRVEKRPPLLQTKKLLSGAAKLVQVEESIKRSIDSAISNATKNLDQLNGRNK
jgi:hypothetical protein